MNIFAAMDLETSGPEFTALVYRRLIALPTHKILSYWRSANEDSI